MLRLSFCLVFFHLHLLTVQQYVQSAAVLSNHDLHVKELLENGTLTDDCKDAINANILSKSPQEWCKSFDITYKTFMIDSNNCDRTEYEKLTGAACTKDDPDIMTARTAKVTTSTDVTQPTSKPTTTATTKIAQVSLNLSESKSTPTHPVTNNVQTTDGAVTVTSNPGVKNTPKSTPPHPVTNNVQTTDGAVTVTSNPGVKNTPKSTPPHPVTNNVQTTDGAVTVTSNPGVKNTPKSNPPHPVTNNVQTTDGAVTVISNPGVTNTPKPVPDSTQTNVSVTPTTHHRVTNTVKNHRPCVFCGSSRITSVGWLFVIVLVYLVNLIS